ncbi:MAG: S-layer homology domain-containing protein [Clostridia bacterium]|nr:S-layer homology domain-containing protein [Clostridia bacterium]
MNHLKRVWCILLSLCLLAGLLTVLAHAEEACSHPQVGQYVYDETTHMAYCADCGELNGKANHCYGGDRVCDVCGYDEVNPLVLEPILIREPGFLTVKSGKDVGLVVRAYGLGLKYQWTKDTQVIGGAADRVLVVKDLTCKSNCVYNCTVSNKAGSVTAEAVLTVVSETAYKSVDGSQHKMTCADCGEFWGQAMHRDFDGNGRCDDCGYSFKADSLKLTANPTSRTVSNGTDSVTFKVSALGNGLSYQWYSDIFGEPLAEDSFTGGTKTPTLTVKLPSADYDCAYGYGGFYCIVRNAEGAVRSATATLKVEHVEAAEYAVPTPQYHEFRCVCGRWSGTVAHTDADKNTLCDGCGYRIEHPFVDVTDTAAWYYNAALYGKTNGLILGEYGSFRADRRITRGEFVTILARNAYTREYIEGLNDCEFEDFLSDLAAKYGVKPVKFTDTEGKFYDRYTRVMAAMGVINGYENGTFRGENSITREELAVMLYRLLDHEVWLDSYGTPIASFNDANKVSSWAREGMEFARGIALFQGDEKGNCNPLSNATRAEVAQTILRINRLPGYLLS